MRPKPCKAREVERLLVRLGFTWVRTGGSHRTYIHADGRITQVPFHSGDVPTGLLRRIIGSIRITVEQFNDEV